MTTSVMNMSKAELRGLSVARDVVDEIRSYTSDTLPSQQMAAFLFIARNDGCRLADLADYLDMSQAATSRTVSALGERKITAGKKPGYKLVESREDPFERRRKNLHLTKQGHNLASRIAKRMTEFAEAL